MDVLGELIVSPRWRTLDVALLVGLPLAALSLAATIDAARRPTSAFRAARRAKWFWVVAPLAGSGFFAIVSGVIGLVWFVAVRRQIPLEPQVA